MIPHGRLGAALLCVTIAVALDATAAEQPTLDTKKVQAALLSTDASTRYEAFAQAVESGRPELREMAVAVGFSSSDPGMQQLAVRAAFIGTMVVVPELLESDVSSEVKSLFAKYRPDIEVVTYDWRAGSINKPNAEQGFGQVSGNSVAYSVEHTNYDCSVSMRRVDQSWEYRGTAKCYGHGGEYNVSVSYLMR